MTERVHPAKPQAARNTSASWPPLTRPTQGPGLSPVARAGTSSGGQALGKRTSAEMSAHFGHDFSQVRIHTDARAEESADALGAHAYAHGSDIVFGQGRYVPGSPDTERLLAHELTHVVQQAQWGGGDWGRMSQRGDASEREADSLAAQVMTGRSVQVQAAPGAAIARDERDDRPGQAPSINPGTLNVPGAADGTQHGDGNMSLSGTWTRPTLLPDSLQLDISKGKALDTSSSPPTSDKTSPTLQLPPPGPRLSQADPAAPFTPGAPHSDICTPNDTPPVPLGPGYQYAPAPGGDGLLGKPFDPSQPYGDPSTWAPSPFAPGAF